ncbi:MAG: hypothetical protein AAF334_02850 [Pseudomonadota bacterium]
MSVETVLNKIREHNSDVIGCIVMVGGRLWTTLPDLYAMIDAAGAAEHAANLFAVTDGLETDHAPMDQLFIEFDNHSFYARRLEEGVLLLLNTPIQRAQFKKMQIGVNLFVKPLVREIARAPATPQIFSTSLSAETAAAESPAAAISAGSADDAPPAQRRRLLYRGIEY